MIAYRANQELSALTLEWKNRDGTVIDFSTGWTFTALVCARSAPTTVLLAKTSGITGAATSPNITIDWATTDFSGLTASATGTGYVVHVKATRTADSKDAYFRPERPVEFFLYTTPA